LYCSLSAGKQLQTRWRKAESPAVGCVRLRTNASSWQRHHSVRSSREGDRPKRQRDDKSKPHGNSRGPRTDTNRARVRRAKKVLSVAGLQPLQAYCKTGNRARAPKDEVEIAKTNFLLIGPTGLRQQDAGSRRGLRALLKRTVFNIETRTHAHRGRLRSARTSRNIIRRLALQKKKKCI